MSTTTHPAGEYLKARVLTASPEELRLMLLDGAIKFAKQGRAGLAGKDYEASFNGISQARSIVLELLTSIRDEFDPDLAGKVRSLYTFLYTELTNASLEKSVSKIDKVVQILEYERETWALLMEQIKAKQTPAADSPEAGDAGLSLSA